jgi:FkbM family methyltransferase
MRSSVAMILARERAFRRRTAANRPITVTATIPFRVHIRVRPNSSDLATFREVFVDEVYGALPHVIPEVDWIVDLGANIGLSSLYLLQRYPGARVLAVEPHEVNVALLRHNLEPWVASGRCRIVHAAAWSEDCVLCSATPSDAMHFASFRVRVPATSDVATIRGLSMRSLFEETAAREVQLVKIDVEGAESALFTSDTSWLDVVRCIAVEFHGDSRATSRFDELMAERGFRIVSETAHTVIALESPE